MSDFQPLFCVIICLLEKLRCCLNLIKTHLRVKYATSQLPQKTLRVMKLHHETLHILLKWVLNGRLTENYNNMVLLVVVLVDIICWL